MTPLHDLADAVGVVRVWEDAQSRPQTVADAVLKTILTALGFPAADDTEVAASLARLADEQAQVPTYLAGDVGEPLPLLHSLADETTAILLLEDGRERHLAIASGMLPAIAETGYHRLRIADAELALIIAPPRCLLPADLSAAAASRMWGIAIQLPSLRERATAYGDLADLRHAATLLAGQGADAIAISPVHAPPPGQRAFYPYSPSSRLFLNPALAQAPGGESEALIDWSSALAAQTQGQRQAFARLTETDRAQLAQWAAGKGDHLARHALFDALALHFGSADWRSWPQDYRSPDGLAAQQFAREHPEEIAFHVFGQWQAEQALGTVQSDAKRGGMAIGLIADLAVGVDPGGSDGWSMQDAMLTGLTIGAPPDPLGPDGQNWALTSFSPQGLRRTAFAPFIAMLRAALRHAGGVRIDHAFGLSRLWVVPQGASASDGAYLRYPFADLLRVIALESHRAGAVIVGEDLGTRPPGFVSPVADKGILGMRVLWFERDEDGFRAADAFPAQSVGMTGTHDTATIAGWWTGNDIQWNRRLQRGGDWQTEETNRMADRSALWSVIGDDKPQPAVDDPAPAVDAAVAHLASTPTALAIIPLEDLLGLEEQPNLPGTIDQHPNWRRRLSAPLADLLTDPSTARRVASLIAARPA